MNIYLIGGKRSHLCWFHWDFLQFPLFPQLHWCLMEHGTHHLSNSPFHHPLFISAFPGEDSPGKAAQCQDPSHPKASIPEESRGWRGWGSPSLSPCWRKALASAVWESPHKVAKPSAAGICIFWPQQTGKEPHLALFVYDVLRKPRIYTDVYKINIEIWLKQRFRAQAHRYIPLQANVQHQLAAAWKKRYE